MTAEEIKNNRKKIVLFGAIDNVFTRYFCSGEFNVLKIVDNDQRLHGKRINGIKIYSVDSLINDNADELTIIIMSKRYAEEMIKQIKSFGINDYCVAEDDIDELKDYSIILKSSGSDINNLMPTALNIELSGICNLKCVYCPFHGELNKKHNKGLMSWDTLQSVVKQLKPIDCISTLSTVGNGEVFVHPEWYEMTKYILSELNVKTLCLYTNGMLLSEEVVRKLNSFDNVNILLEISIDGTTPEECEKYRKGCKYSVIRDNLYYALDNLNDNINVTILNLYMPKEDDLVKTNYKVQFKNPEPQYIKNDFPNINIISRKAVIDGDELGEIKGFKKILVKKEAPYSTCFNTFFRLAIDNEGNLIRCSCSKAFNQIIGNVRESNILEKWKNDEQMKLARQHILDKVYDKDFCSGCEQKSKEPYFVLVEDKLNV